MVVIKSLTSSVPPKARAGTVTVVVAPVVALVRVREKLSPVTPAGNAVVDVKGVAEAVLKI
jgi:hypothetical protein